MRNTYKKPLALLLSAAMLFTLSGSPIYASNSSLLPETGTRSALPAQTATSSNAATPSNAPAPVAPASTAAATATFSNAVENQDPVVSADWKDSHWEFTDFFDALRWIQGLENVTLTLLNDVMVTQQIELTPTSNIFDNLTVDLNTHTLSGNFDDEAVVYLNPATAYHIAFKNGTIENTAENGTAVQLWDGQITMENINIKGDFVIRYTFLNSGSYTPTFLGGGTIRKLRTESKYPANFSQALGPGCYFVDSSGSRVQGETLTSNTALENITVKSCPHENGFVLDRSYRYFTRYICETCGNFCKHDTRTADDRKCSICGMEINAISRNSRNTQYAHSFNDAMSLADWYYTVMLLDDQYTSYNFTTIGLSVDFNGHTLTMTGNNGHTTSELYSGPLTFQNTGTTQGHFVGTLRLNAYRPSDGKLIIPAGIDLLIDTLEVRSGIAALSGGTFGTITVSDGNTLTGLLAPGYCYEQDGTIIVPSDSDTTLTNVTVVPCDHTSEAVESIDESTGFTIYKCPCGEVTFSASVTKNGNSLYYADVQDALDHASGGTFRFLSTFPDAQVSVPDNVTLDLSGISFYSNTFNPDSELVINGRATLLSQGITYDGTSSPAYFDIPITVRPGGTLIVPEFYNDSEKNQLELPNSITIETGGHAQLDSGVYRWIYVNKDSELDVSGGSNIFLDVNAGGRAVLSGGSYRSLNLNGVCDVTISGGSFGKIRLYETDVHSAPVRPEVTYVDFFALLVKGSGFLKADGSWLSKDDIISDPEYLYARGKYIENVTVADAPVLDVTVYANVSSTAHREPLTVQYGAQIGSEFSLMPDISFKTGVAPSASFQWYQVNSDGTMTELKEGFSAALTLSPVMPVGTYTYLAEITCGGYICCSSPYTVTVTPRELRMTVDEASLTKVYDGTADVPEIKPIFTAVDGGELPDTDKITWTVRDSWYFDPSDPETPDPDFADEKGVSFLCALTDPNYSFAGGKTEERFLHGQAPYITKATASNAAPGTLTVRNHTEAVYRFDFKTLLPDPGTQKKYGALEYLLEEIDLGSYYDSGASVNDGVLSLPVRSVDSTLEQPVGTVTVKVISQNYQTFFLTLQVNAVNKELPDEDNKPGGNSGSSSSNGGTSSPEDGNTGGGSSGNGNNSGGSHTSDSNSSSDSDDDSSYEEIFQSTDQSGRTSSGSPSSIRIPPAVPDKNGSMTLDHNMIQFAIKAARKTLKKNGRPTNGIAVFIPAASEKNHSSLSVTINARTLDTLVREHVAHLGIGLDSTAAAYLDADLLRWLNTSFHNADIILKLQPATPSSDSSKPAYSLSVFFLSDGKETPIVDLGSHSVTIK